MATVSPILPNRALLREHSQELWDIIVVGGGATGLGIALDATTRGYKVLLLERADFAKGTSSRSTKLVHGGVRYLAQGYIKLVREASVERGLLCKNAAHLVKVQPFIVPVYNWSDAAKYYIGLKLYDWIAGGYSLGSSVFFSSKKTAEKLPGINTKNLIGGIQYFDGQFDDARLAIDLFKTIWAHGGYAFNYTQVTGFEKDAAGKICGVQATDAETGEKFSFKTKAVVNATGVFADELLALSEPGATKTICASQGVHLVVDKKFCAGNEALMIPKTSDGRVLFAVPWQNKLLLGTTDTPVKNISQEPVALRQEIDFILQNAGAYLSQQPGTDDVQSVFAGLRPLALPKEGSKKTKEISRSHKIVVNSSGLFTMLGGKWTTYRRMAEDMLDKIEESLLWPRRACKTKTLQIFPTKITLRSETSLSNKFIINDSVIAQAINEEMCRTVEDLLARRTRILFLDAVEAIRLAPAVAKKMAELLGKDEAWITAQVKAFEAISKGYLMKDTSI